MATLDSRRILLGALALAVVSALVVVRLARPTPAAESAPPAPTGSFDIADQPARFALRDLQEAAPDWLGNHCDTGTPDTYRVSARPGYRPDAEYRDARIIVRGGTGRVSFRRMPGMGPWSGDPGPPARTVAFDAMASARLRALLEQAGYPASIAPGENGGCMDSGERLMETCLAGRYHGFVRTCFDEAAAPLVDNVLTLAEDAVEKSP